MRQMRLRSNRLLAGSAGVAAGVAIAGLAATSLGHDDDYRKLADRLAPVEGPIYRLGDAIPRSGGFNASGVTMLSQIPLNNFAGAHSTGNDCWGYTSPSGREYAIMGLERGFGFVEITNPTNPQIIATIQGPASLWHDIKVIGTFAYGVSEGGAGIQVIDLSNIDAGQVTLLRNVQDAGHSTTHNIVADEDSGNLYLTGSNLANGGLVWINLNDPANPRIGGAWSEMYVHDAQVVTYTEGPFAGREIAYLASGFGNGSIQTGLRIVDVTNKSNMFTIATLFYPGAAYSHQLWLSEDRTTLYLNDELDEQNGLASTTLTRLIDVSDPSSPAFVGTFTTGRPAVDHNLYTRGPLMYQANYRSGLRIMDIGDPRNPQEIGFFDTFPGSDAPSFNGAWSVYPFFPSGTVIVSDIERGLFVFRVDAQPQPRISLSTPLGRPEMIDPAGGDEVTVSVAEVNATVDASSLTMFVDDGTGVRSVQGSPVAGEPGRFSFAFPSVSCDDAVRYWFSAESDGGLSVTLPAGAPSDAFTAIVASDITVGFSDSFQTNNGWSISGDATEGVWRRGAPLGGGDRGDPPADFDGTNTAYFTDNRDDNTDVDGGSTTLTSPTLDASGGDTYLTYARWYNNSAGSSPAEDVFTVEVSNNNGGSWTQLEQVGPGGLEVAGGWFERSFRLSDVFANPSSQFRVRFTASDLGSGSVVEAAVDAVRIETIECEETNPCVADWNESGAVDIFDVLAYLSDWDAGEPAADLDGNPGLSVFDILTFLDAWNAGCP